MLAVSAGPPTLHPLPKRNPFDADPTDAELAAEVHRLTTLILAANGSDTRLDQGQIDAVLFAD